MTKLREFFLWLRNQIRQRLHNNNNNNNNNNVNKDDIELKPLLQHQEIEFDEDDETKEGDKVRISRRKQRAMFKKRRLRLD
jgi:hypothetical protein